MKRLSAFSSAILGLLLRLPNLGWGLPDVDEEAYPLKKALEMWDWTSGTVAWNPQTLGWPSFSFYIHLFLQHLHYLVGRLLGQFDQRLDYLVAFAADHHDLLILSRLLGVLASCGVIYLAARLAQKLTGGLGGWLAGLLLAFSPLLISHSQLITPDILLTFFAALATVATVVVYEKGRRRDYLLAGLWLGLGISCKYTPVLLFGALYGAHLLARYRDGGRLTGADFLASEMGLAVGAGVVAFFVTSPFFFLDSELIDRDFTYQILHMNQGHFGHNNSLPGYVYYFSKVLVPGLGLPAVLLGLFSLGAMAWRRRGVWLVLALSGLCFYGPVSLLQTRFDRYMLPVLFPLALGLAALPILLKDLWENRNWQPRFFPWFSVLVAGLVLVPTITGANRYHRDKSRPNTLQVARTYILDVLGPSHPILAMESYTPQLQDDIRRDLNLSDSFALLSASQKEKVTLEDRVLVEYIPMYSVRVELAAYYYDLRHFQPFTHVVISSAVRDRYLAEPKKFPQQVRFYSDLEEYTREVKRFSAADGMSGPEIVIYALENGCLAGLVAKRGALGPAYQQAYAGRLHIPHYQGFLRGVANAADQAESWELAGFYFDELSSSLGPQGNRELRLGVLERSAYTHLMAKEWARSSQAAEIYLKEVPGDIMLWGYLGKAQEELGNLARSRDCFERCLQLAGDKVELATWKQWAEKQLAGLPENQN